MQKTLALLLFATVALFVVTEARRKGAGGKRNGQGSREHRACSEWRFTDCVSSSGTCGKGVKQGSRNGTGCVLTEREFKCKVPCPDENGCSYTRNGASWGTCDDATNTKSVTLTLAQPHDGCSPTITRTRPCRKSRVERDVDEMLSDRPARRERDGCKYDKGDWSECDETTNTITRTLTLKGQRRGSDGECEQTKSQTKPCRKECKYNRAEWSECDPTTSAKNRTLTLKKGDASACEETKTETKQCKRKQACKYSRGTWSECDAFNDTRSRTLTLKKGDPEHCEATKAETGPCREARAGARDRQGRNKKRQRKNKNRGERRNKDCEYERGEWSDCAANSRSMTKTLKSGDTSSCEATKVVTRPCNGASGGRRGGNKRNKKQKRKERRNRRLQANGDTSNSK